MHVAPGAPHANAAGATVAAAPVKAKAKTDTHASLKDKLNAERQRLHDRIAKAEEAQREDTARREEAARVSREKREAAITPPAPPKAPAHKATPAKPAVTARTSGKVATVIAYAMRQRGKPYVWNAAGPNSFDCSGLVMMAYRQVGISLPHYTGTMVNYGIAVSRANLQPGDLVFPTSSHVQMYIGNGEVISAPHSGANVGVSKLDGFWRARRIIH
jgi:cell wall-associated NlpC family hydrolase